MVLDGKELLESALAEVHFCSDATWVENDFQRRNRNLIRNVKIMQNAIDDKSTDSEKARTRTGTPSVRQTIPFSRLATYGDYEYDEALERLHEPVTEPTQYESDLPVTESTEPWMMREVEDLFKHYTSDTLGQHNTYGTTFLGSNLLSPWDDKPPVENCSQAFYGTNVALPHYASTPRASEAEEELHRHVYSDEQRRSWEEHSSTLSAHRRTVCRPSGTRSTSSPATHIRDTDETAYNKIPLPEPTSVSSFTQTLPYLKMSPWKATPRTNDTQVSPLDKRSIAKDFDALRPDVLDGSFSSSNSSSPLQLNSQRYFPSSSESMHEEELFPYRQTPMNTPPKCLPCRTSPSFQIPVINSETCPMPGPSRPPPGFSKKISVYQRPHEYYTYPDRRTHGANFNNLIYLPTQDGQENSRKRGGPYSGLLNVPLLETDTSPDRTLVREIEKGAQLFEQDFPSLCKPTTSTDQEVPSFRPSPILECKEFPALAKSPVDPKLSMASTYTWKGKDFLPSPIPQTSKTSNQFKLHTSPIMPPRDYDSCNSEFLWPESQDFRNKGTEGRCWSSDLDQSWFSQGASTMPTSIERFSDRKGSGAQNNEPVFGNPLTLPTYENHVTWLNQHYARRAKTFHHVLQLTDELTTIEQQLDEEMEQSLRARRDAEGESPSTQLELEKDFPPIMGTPKRVQKRKKKPDDMSLSSDWAKSSASMESLRHTALDYGLYCRRSYKDVCANKSDIQNSTYDSLIDYDLETDADCRNNDDPNEMNVDLSWVDRLLEDDEELALETDGGSQGRSELMKELYSRELKKMLMELEEQRLTDKPTEQEEAESRRFENEWNMKFDKLIAEMGGHEMSYGVAETSPAVEEEETKEDTENSPKGESMTREIETPVEFETEEKAAPSEKESLANEKEGNCEVISENFQQPGSSPSKLSDENLALKYQGLEKHALGKQKCQKDKEVIIPNASPNIPTPTSCAKGKQKKKKKKKDESRKLTLVKENLANNDSKEEICPTSSPTTATSPRPTSPPEPPTPAQCRQRLEFVVQPPRQAAVSSDESDRSEEDCPKIVLVRGSGLLVKEIARTRQTRAKPETPEVVKGVESQEIYQTPSCPETAKAEPTVPIGIVEALEVTRYTLDTPDMFDTPDKFDTTDKLSLTPSKTSNTSFDNADKTIAKPTWMKQQRKKVGGGKKKRKGPKPLPVNQRDEFWSYITLEYQHLEKLLQYDVLYVLSRREGSLFVDNYTQTDYVFNDLEVNDDGSDVIAEVTESLAIVENGIETFSGDENYDVGSMPLEALSVRFAEKREQLSRQNAMHVHYGTCHVLRLLRDTRKYRTEVKGPTGLCLPLTDEYAKSIIACGGYPKQAFFQTYLHSRQTEYIIEKLKGLTSVYSFPSAKTINKDNNAVIDYLLECLESMHTSEEFFSAESFAYKETQTGMSTKQISKCKNFKILSKKLFETVVEQPTPVAPQPNTCSVCDIAGPAPSTSTSPAVPCTCANKSDPLPASDPFHALNIPPMSGSLTVDLPALSPPSRSERRRPLAPPRAPSTPPEPEATSPAFPSSTPGEPLYKLTKNGVQVVKSGRTVTTAPASHRATKLEPRYTITKKGLKYFEQEAAKAGRALTSPPPCPTAMPGEPVYKITKKNIKAMEADFKRGAGPKRVESKAVKLPSNKPQVSMVKPGKSILKTSVPLALTNSVVPTETAPAPITPAVSPEIGPPLLPVDLVVCTEKISRKTIRERMSQSAPRDRTVAHGVLLNTSSDVRPSQRARRFRSVGSRICRAASASASSPVTATCEAAGRNAHPWFRAGDDGDVGVNSSIKKMGPNGEGRPSLVRTRRCAWSERSPVRKPEKPATSCRTSSFSGLCGNFQRAVCRPSVRKEVTREQPGTVTNVGEPSLRDQGVITCQPASALSHESLKTIINKQTQAISDSFQQTQLAHDKILNAHASKQIQSVQRLLDTFDQTKVSKQTSDTIKQNYAVGVESKQTPEVSLTTNGVSGLTRLPIADVSMNFKQIVPGKCSPVEVPIPNHVNKLASEQPKTIPLPTQSSLDDSERTPIQFPPPPCKTEVEVQTATFLPPLPRSSFLHPQASPLKPRTKTDILCARRRFPKQVAPEPATTEPAPAGSDSLRHSAQPLNNTSVPKPRFQDMKAGRDQSSSGKSIQTFFGSQKEVLTTTATGVADASGKGGGEKAVATRKKKKGGTTGRSSCGEDEEVKKKDDACSIS